MTYHQTKYLLYGKHLLGHKSITSTMLYTQLVGWDNPNHFTCKVVDSNAREEMISLVEQGWKYVTEFDGAKLFRKRK